MTRLLFLGTLLGLAGCANPMTLTYDFGRAYTAASITQADLSRPSVAAAQYRLSGIEGTEIRLRLQERTTEGTYQDQSLGLGVQ
ncbi:MAG: hypothetical protein EA397_20095 [Deltaproteobacteria bacterium]|nr:MAG: hypothetical protein EA397_20095 [Deltaproteobacteria bacterium]